MLYRSYYTTESMYFEVGPTKDMIGYSMHAMQHRIVVVVVVVVVVRTNTTTVYTINPSLSVFQSYLLQ